MNWGRRKGTAGVPLSRKVRDVSFHVLPVWLRTPGTASSIRIFSFRTIKELTGKGQGFSERGWKKIVLGSG